MNIVFVGNFAVSYSSETHHANSLETLGHRVVRMQEGKARTDQILRVALRNDLLIWVHTHGWKTKGYITYEQLHSQLSENNIPIITYHLDLYMGIGREKDLLEDQFYKELDYFFTVDKLMADWFNENTSVKGRFMPPGVYDREVEYSKLPIKNDVIFVGSRNYHKEWAYRKELIEELERKWGDKFTQYGNGGVMSVRGKQLNDLYNSSKVVVGDTLCIGFDYPYYLSDRIMETTGRGGFMIHPYIKGLEDLFEIDKEVVTYEFGNFEQLHEKIRYYLEHDTEREAIRKAGHERTKRDHTYVKRWEAILKEVFND